MGRLVSLGVAAFLMSLPGCSLSTEGSAPSIENTTFAPSVGVDLSKMTKQSSGLYYRDLVVGSRAVVARGQLLKVHYTAWLANGTKFDTNGPNDTPFPFVLGAGQVIGGWDDGLVGMNVGNRDWETIRTDNILYILNLPEVSQNNGTIQHYVVRRNGFLQGRVRLG